MGFFWGGGQTNMGFFFFLLGPPQPRVGSPEKTPGELKKILNIHQKKSRGGTLFCQTAGGGFSPP